MKVKVIQNPEVRLGRITEIDLFKVNLALDLIYADVSLPAFDERCVE